MTLLAHTGDLVVDYVITAIAEPGIAPRVLNLFAQRGLIVDRLELARDGDTHRIRIHQPGLDPATAAIIAAKLDTIIGVASVAWRTEHAADEA